MTESSGLDKTNDTPTCTLLMRVSIDNFTGEEPTPDQMTQLAVDLAKSWSGQVMTSKSLITYEVIPIKDFVWLDEDEIDEHRAA